MTDDYNNLPSKSKEKHTEKIWEETQVKRWSLCLEDRESLKGLGL